MLFVTQNDNRMKRMLVRLDHRIAGERLASLATGFRALDERRLLVNRGQVGHPPIGDIVHDAVTVESYGHAEGP